MKRLLCMLLALCLFSVPALALETLSGEDIVISAPSAVLMEKSTGTLLYEKDAHTHYSPASVTKVMTMLLVMEALDAGVISYDTMVTASAHAASMGGSQIWLEEGERMTVDEMLKCVTVVSANDCAVALAEHIAGSEDAFVRRMNERAAELGMKDSHFTNCTGLLESEDHYSCAYDIALMSRELIQHEEIKKYTTIWMDTARGGEFGLSNTNRLIFYYDGATGLKTGFTSKAMYCLSATAEREGVEYIAVVMHAQTSQERFDSAKILLNHAFANYELLSLRPDRALPPLRVTLGTADSVQPVYDGPETMVVKKGSASELRYEIEMEPSVKAPVLLGQPLGALSVHSGEELLARIPLRASSAVERQSFWQLYGRLLQRFFGLEM